MDVDQSVGWRVGEGCGGGGVGINDLGGGYLSGLECSAVIDNEVQVGMQDVVVKIEEELQFGYVLLPDGVL